MGVIDLRHIHSEHEDNKENFQWYVLMWDVNLRETVMFNIFNNWKFCQDVKKLLDTELQYNTFVEKLRREISYYFWSKSEYEIYVGDSEPPRYIQKVDVYNQLLPNLNNLAEYIINTYLQEKEK